MPSSRGSSQPRNWTHVSYVSCIGRWVFFFYHKHHLGSSCFDYKVYQFSKAATEAESSTSPQEKHGWDTGGNFTGKNQKGFCRCCCHFPRLGILHDAIWTMERTQISMFSEASGEGEGGKLWSLNHQIPPPGYEMSGKLFRSKGKRRIVSTYTILRASWVAQLVRIHLHRGDPSLTPGSGRSPGEGIAPHSIIHGFPWWLRQ